MGKQGLIPEQEGVLTGLNAPGEHTLPPWDLYTVCVCLLSGYILVPLMLSNVLLLVNPFMGEAELMFVQQCVTLLTWLSIFGLLQWKYGRLRHYLGMTMTMTMPGRYYAWETMLLLIVSNGLTLALSLFWALVEKLNPGINLGTDPYADFSSPQLWVLIFFAVVVAPLQEELIFRGLVQSTFHKVCSRVWSVIWTGLIFMMLHGTYLNNVKALAHVVVLGLCFGIWRERTRSLMPGMVAHLFNNGLATLIMMLPKGS